MRKMTKTAAILAAMSAMTVASASMAFAATAAERTNLSSVGREANVDAEAVGKWEETNKGWTFTPDGESKLEKTWAQIDGVWYYFDTDGYMLQDELLYIDGETYYLNPDGSMMADGWVSFSNGSDVVWEYGIDIDEYEQDIVNTVTDGSEYSKIWMYFDENGIAKDDEWYQSDSGLWYYFDDIVMVAADFDHVISGNAYGFDKNGAMLVGWAENYDDHMKTAPNKDERVWYYYDTNGKKFKANVGYNNSYGWKKIDGEWYCFYREGASVGTLIVNSFFTNDAAGDGNSDYYYVDKKGVMQTGVVTVDKDAKFVTNTYSEAAHRAYTWADGQQIKNLSGDKKGVEVYIDSNGKVQANTWKNDRFYANAGATNVYMFDDAKVSNAVSTASYDTTTRAAIKGAVVRNAFVNKDGFYYVDEDGDMLKNSAIEIGKFVGKGTNFTLGAETTLATGEYKAFVLAAKNGEIYKAGEVATTRKVTVGAKSYIATAESYNGMQVFYYSNEN